MRPVPDQRELAELLRSCIQCGLCLPHCATWASTGNEVLSPRGRLVLMQQILTEPGASPSPESLQSFDQCIGCRACETACPSGVPFSLFEHGKDLAAAARQAGTLVVEKPAVPSWLLKRLDQTMVLRGLKKLSRLAVGSKLQQLAAGMPSPPARDAELVALLDDLVGRSPAGNGHPPLPVGEPVVVIDFFSGCANAGLLPDSSRRLIDLLRRCGCEVRIPAGQGCCGALAAHTGRSEDRVRLHRSNENAFATVGPGRWIVVEAAGCGVELKEQYDLGSAEVLDATEALVRLTLPKARPVPLRVAYHAACHLEHGQHVSESPRALLHRIPGLELLEPEDAALCCGSGGVWSLEHPDLAAEIGVRKARALIATDAQLIVTTNPGCLGQIQGALAALDSPLPIIPLTDLLWYACGA